MSTFDIAWIDEAAQMKLRALRRLNAEGDARHMAAKVRALSYRVPLFMRFGDRGFAYSVSGWQGAL